MEVQEAALKTDFPQPVVTAPLTLSMNIIGQRKEADGSYTEVLVSEGSVLRSYDNFQVHLETNRPAYVYILLYDSQGSASQLFPDPKIDQRGFLEQGRKTVVPANDLWFWLDEHTGTETIYVLTSEKPMSDIQGLLSQDGGSGRRREEARCSGDQAAHRHRATWRRRHHQRPSRYLHAKRWEKDSEGDRSSDRNRIGRESGEFSAQVSRVQ